MQSTLRERHRWVMPLSIWCLLIAAATVAGPFGTLDLLSAPVRGLYWSGIVGVSIGLSYLALTVARGRSALVGLAVWGGFVILCATFVHALNDRVFLAWGGLADWAYLAAIVGLVTALVHLVICVAGPRTVSADVHPPGDATFQRRLPLEVRGPLVRIEAQDHYLNVVTQRGSALVLMRLGDAIDELPRENGMQVHRSHWVALEAIDAHQRIKGRDFLAMRDGTQVPISRSYRAASKAAGLF